MHTSGYFTRAPCMQLRWGYRTGIFDNSPKVFQPNVPRADIVIFPWQGDWTDDWWRPLVGGRQNYTPAGHTLGTHQKCGCETLFIFPPPMKNDPRGRERKWDAKIVSAVKNDFFHSRDVLSFSSRPKTPVSLPLSFSKSIVQKHIALKSSAFVTLLLVVCAFSWNAQSATLNSCLIFSGVNACAWQAEEAPACMLETW